jgi:hypothetical protein
MRRKAETVPFLFFPLEIRQKRPNIGDSLAIALSFQFFSRFNFFLDKKREVI